MCFLKYLFYLKTTVETLQFVSQQCKYFVTGFFAKMLVTQAKEPYSKEMFFLPWLTYKEWVYCSCCWKDFFVMLFHLTEWLLIVNSVSNYRIYYIIVFSGHTLFNFSTDVILLFFLYSALEVLQKMLLNLLFFLPALQNDCVMGVCGTNACDEMLCWWYN